MNSAGDQFSGLDVAEINDLRAQLVDLLRAIEHGEIASSAATIHRIQGALVALDVVVHGPAADLGRLLDAPGDTK